MSGFRQATSGAYYVQGKVFTVISTVGSERHTKTVEDLAYMLANPLEAGWVDHRETNHEDIRLRIAKGSEAVVVFSASRVEDHQFDMNTVYSM